MSKEKCLVPISIIGNLNIYVCVDNKLNIKSIYIFIYRKE